MIYPILYFGLLHYFTKTTHFWNLCKIKQEIDSSEISSPTVERASKYNTNMVHNLVLFGVVISFTFATAQKIIWADQQDKIDWTQEFGELVVTIIFSITVVMRLCV